MRSGFGRTRGGTFALLGTAFLAGLPGGTAHAQEGVAGSRGRGSAAAEPLVTDRPDFTESAVTVTPGRWQLELGYTFARSGDEKRHSFGELLIRVGALSWLEARLGLNSFALVDLPEEDRDGLENLSLGAKARLFTPAPDGSGLAPETALLFGMVFPTGSPEIGDDGTQPAAALALGWSLSEWLSLGSNVGWRYATGEERFHQFLASVSAGFAIDARVGGFAEYYGLYPGSAGGSGTHFLDTGLTLLVGPNVQLDWRIGIGLVEPHPNWFTGLGIGFRL